ncbi:MAG: head GIN domain-containing protein [Hydrogenophaga sp.]|nr:head GIN domain-containing protein [Hydrogenophaga sp.]
MKKNWNLMMILWLVAFSLAADSCIAHISGNGKVVKQERAVTGFDEISVSTGIEVILTQDTFEKVVVETDENIQKILKTEVTGNKLKIYLEEGVNHVKEMKVHVTLKQVKSVSASAGSEVKTANKINAENLKISSSSGSEVNMEVGGNMVSLDSSSGSELTVSGTAVAVNAESSSGSELDASKLVAEKGEASASSGSDMDVHVTKEIKAHASSGSNITVTGNPAIRDTNSSSGGDIDFK